MELDLIIVNSFDTLITNRLGNPKFLLKAIHCNCVKSPSRQNSFFTANVQDISGET